MELTQVTPAEILFKEKLSMSEFSAIFLVVVREQLCVMKVHHGRGPREYYEPVNRELDIHVREYTAYCRLKNKGLCGCVVPNLLGRLRKFDPKLCRPHLDTFISDKYLPSALLLQYIPHMEMIHLHNFSENRMDNLIMGIQAIHQALVRHRDPKPRNMMVLKNDPGRVMWIDFDRAETYDEDTITERQEELLAEEEDIVRELKECLQADCLGGELKESYLFYC
ncbi:uncharacterized protein BO80DRAFT_494873 [Aspergillus ibericus CBS 121593]|uniref:Protein kinase domain-containing protein n=1 Tax=Aspergillus ibericus CBS 121593 TaxID=1448316 RepID=A0A395GW93_9EURO|nr:hypothetical protein BO80DRAFT_494873 [Aspergillus ibericus CBS 121593]RAK99288.1 hypothetical protein BO80DRAFT_494873 [Aspergillus ibericus CBS 121593]